MCVCTQSKQQKFVIQKCLMSNFNICMSIWYEAAKSNLKKLQIVQNKCLKIIYNKHWRYWTQLLHSETGYQRIEDFIKTLNKKYFENVENSSYQMIRDCSESTRGSFLNKNHQIENDMYRVYYFYIIQLYTYILF